MINVALDVNGQRVERTVDERTLLVRLLREDLGLTGTHVGCDTTQCGACTVLVDGDAVKSCTMLAAQAKGCSVVTIEGLAPVGQLHPVQQVFHEHHGLQCGYCTPGFVMSIVELVSKYRELDEHRVRELVDGNICRCTGYHNIVRAALAAADAIRQPRVDANAGSL
jgi:aerobic carbon-monoxide dehydrogenase small subunit